MSRQKTHIRIINASHAHSIAHVQHIMQSQHFQSSMFFTSSSSVHAKKYPPPFHWAIMKQDWHLFCLCLAEADQPLINEDQTAFYLAMNTHIPEYVEPILKNMHTDLISQGLRYAVEFSSFAVCELLVEYDADPLFSSHNTSSAMDFVNDSQKKNPHNKKMWTKLHDYLEDAVYARRNRRLPPPTGSSSSSL